jgi:hypothetical protein
MAIERREAETAKQYFSAFILQRNPGFSDSGEYVGPAQFSVEGGSVIDGQGLITWDATGECGHRSAFGRICRRNFRPCNEGSC